MSGTTPAAGFSLPEVLREFPDQSNELPGSLVKFTDHRGLGILVGGELKVTPPREFNDPFEFSPGVLQQEPSISELREHFLAPDGFARETLFAPIGQGSEKRYQQQVEKVMLKRPDLAMCHLGWLREAIRNRFSAAFGVACFSALNLESPIAIRHWAIYGGDHSGLAIEFNGRHRRFQIWAQGKLCFRVGYEVERPKCLLRDFNDRSFEAQVVLLRRWSAVKSKAWEAESEWRLITSLIGTKEILCRRVVGGDKITYLLQLWDPEKPTLADTQIIRRVVLGCRASEDLRASVRAACSRSHLRHVIVTEARENDTEFRLDHR